MGGSGKPGLSCFENALLLGMSIKESWRRHEREVVIHWYQRANFSWEENTFRSVGQTRMQHNC